jgi:hypothetical protein
MSPDQEQQLCHALLNSELLTTSYMQCSGKYREQEPCDLVIGALPSVANRISYCLFFLDENDRPLRNYTVSLPSNGSIK